MENLFWNIFEKSGDINAFLAYTEYKNNNIDKTENTNIINEE